MDRLFCCVVEDDLGLFDLLFELLLFEVLLFLLEALFDSSSSFFVFADCFAKMSIGKEMMQVCLDLYSFVVGDGLCFVVGEENNWIVIVLGCVLWQVGLAAAKWCVCWRLSTQSLSFLISRSSFFGFSFGLGNNDVFQCFCIC